jgi:hypothetical protein
MPESQEGTAPLTRSEQNPPNCNDGSVIEKRVLSDEKIYEEAVKVIAIFWEWRDKTLSRYVAVTGGLIAVAGWLFQQANGIRIWQSLPLFACAVFSYISFLLDDRHKEIFLKGYSITAKIELKGREDENGAIYTHIRDLHEKQGSLTQILRRLYWGSTVFFLVLTIAVILIATYRAAVALFVQS